MKNDKGFDIRIDMRENTVLIHAIRKWLLSRKMIDFGAMIMVQMKKFVHFEYINYKFLFRLKMSWFKNFYSSQETKFVYEKSKSKSKDDDKKENTEEQEAVNVGKFKIDESQESSTGVPGAD